MSNYRGLSALSGGKRREIDEVSFCRKGRIKLQNENPRLYAWVTRQETGNPPFVFQTRHLSIRDLVMFDYFHEPVSIFLGRTRNLPSFVRAVIFRLIIQIVYCTTFLFPHSKVSFLLFYSALPGGQERSVTPFHIYTLFHVPCSIQQY